MSCTHIIIHHTGAEEKDAEQVKRYHLSLGWRDTGYNYVIERSGRIVEGRPQGIPGAHCRAQGMNRRALGVAVIGNMEEHQMLPAQQKALVKLLQQLSATHGIPATHILGHREVPGTATACPGRFTDMKALRAGLAGYTEGGVTIPGGKAAPAKTLWRVQVGAFSARENAESYARSLKQEGIDAFVVKS